MGADAINESRERAIIDSAVRKVGARARNWSESQADRFHESIAYARGLHGVALALEAERLAAMLAVEYDDTDSTITARTYFEPIAAAVSYVMRERSRSNIPLAANPEAQIISQLIDEVKDGVTIPDFIESTANGWEIKRLRNESHSPCPWCGGTDRFVISHGVPSLGWCRQCRSGGSVIDIAAAMWGLDLDSPNNFPIVVEQLARRFLVARVGSHQ